MSAGDIFSALAAGLPAFYHFLAPKAIAPQAILLPVGFGYCIASVVGSVWLTTFMGMKVGAARKAANVPYPLMYAEKDHAEKDKAAHIFNCTQRAHQNTLENLTQFIFLTLFNGLFHPKAAAALSATWVVARVLYMIGYTTGVPKQRIMGAVPGGIAFMGKFPSFLRYVHMPHPTSCFPLHRPPDPGHLQCLQPRWSFQLQDLIDPPSSALLLSIPRGATFNAL